MDGQRCQPASDGLREPWRQEPPNGTGRCTICVWRVDACDAPLASAGGKFARLEEARAEKVKSAARRLDALEVAKGGAAASSSPLRYPSRTQFARAVCAGWDERRYKYNGKTTTLPRQPYFAYDSPTYHTQGDRRLRIGRSSECFALVPSSTRMACAFCAAVCGDMGACSSSPRGFSLTSW